MSDPKKIIKMNKMKVKNRRESESDESNHQSSNLDLSLMRQPVTAITGFEEVLRAYEAGTSELRKLMSRECDLIYECKVCRNIFRSLTNFISHKRVYCRTSFNVADHFHFRENGFQIQDVSTIIQAEQEVNNNPNGAAGILPGSDDKSKDLSGIVERLLFKQHQSRTSNLDDFYDQIRSSRRTSPEGSSSQKSQTLKLNRVNESEIAVYQSLQHDDENKSTNMKEEISEVHKMLQNSGNTILGPDGKVLNLFSDKENGLTATSDIALAKLVSCQVCSLEFETEKTLKLHLELKHLPSTYMYQCPSCPQKFSSAAAVIKHLSNDHKKNNRRIRLMRDNIIKKRLRADEVVNKIPTASRELQKLQQGNSSEILSEDASVWTTNDLKGNYLDDSNTCPSCFKKFDRKAVYTSHVQACSDAKCREKEKLTKKHKAKDDSKTVMDNLDDVRKFEGQTDDDSLNKRKRKRFNKTKIEKEASEASSSVVVSKEESSSVDWNLDDEEEKKKIDVIKKEIIEDDLKRMQDNHWQAGVATRSRDDDDDEIALIIDEKPTEGESDFNCPQCEKIFETNEKLKYHLNTYHSRQKRFKCKMCEYQGYRKKDTINHLSYVHSIQGDKETLEKYMESVMKALDEESMAKQNELKKNQLKIKRKMAREKQRMIRDAKNFPESTEDAPKSPSYVETVELNSQTEFEIKKEKFKEPPIPPQPVQKKIEKVRRRSVLSSPEVVSNSILEESLKIPKIFLKTKIEPTYDNADGPEKIKRRNLKAFDSQVGQNMLNISKFGKVVKRSSTGDIKESSTTRPIRDRKKPVRQDFLYDLSDLLKKDADAHREQPVGFKRELRKRAMSTHIRETPGLSSFDESTSSETSPSSTVVQISPIKDEDDVPLVRFKDSRSRRMSVFQPTVRFPTPRSPPYKPPPEPTPNNPNAGSAFKMAQKEFNEGRASLFEPKFIWTISFGNDQKRLSTSTFRESVVFQKPTTSAASSILQKLTGKVDVGTASNSFDEQPLSAEQLCKSFDMISESEMDIPDRAINLNPNRQGIMALALEEAGDDICVLQECNSATNSDCDENDDDENKPSSCSTVSDEGMEEAPKIRKNSKSKLQRPKKLSDKRRSGAYGQRLTVMQRLQENKIRKSREQLFKRLFEKKSLEHEQEKASCEDSPVLNLFSES